MTPDRTGVAILSLLIGAVGAPTYYIASGFAFPRGFVNFRGLDLMEVAPVAFLAAYMFTAPATLGIGGAAWRLLHKAQLDGFLSYRAIAMGAAVAFELASERALILPDMIAMAAMNAIVTRLAELHFRSRANSRGNANPSV